MKKEILDIPFRDSFQDFLEKGETILWGGSSIEHVPSIYDRQEDGRKKLNYGSLFFNVFEYIEKIIVVIVFLGILVLQFYIGEVIWYLNLCWMTILVLTFGRKYFKRKQRQNQYAITEKRILFQLAKLPKNEIQEIEFEAIKDCILTKDFEYYGVIFLVMKNPKSVPDKLFETERHSPTLERIEETEKVVQLIRQGIKNANTLA